MLIVYHHFFSFLATGDSFNTLALHFKLGVSTVQKIIMDICDAIWDSLAPTYLPEPKKEDWKNITAGFYQRWNFPNCMGALDRKHVVVQSPVKSGSLYFNYEGTFSLNLMALVDANYKFTNIDIGDYRSNADGSVFKNCEFGKEFLNDDLDVPDPPPLPNYNVSGPVPFCFVGDEAFPLRTDLIRPFPRKDRGIPDDKLILNYRLSRACRIVENAFGILAQRFRVFARRLNLILDNVDKIVKACCVSQFFARESGHTYTSPTAEP